MFPSPARTSAQGSSPRPRSTLHSLSLIGILWFALAVRAFDLERMPPFAHYDEANLAQYSVKVVREVLPWFGVRSDGDPNWAFVQYAPYVLFGGSYWALRVTITLWTAG